MNHQRLQCGQYHQQYRIIAEYAANNSAVALVGFCAQEQTETLLFKHLQNLCVQSDGSLGNIHHLLHGMVQQWQHTFNMPALQTLTHISGQQASKLKSVCLYKTKHGEEEKLINRIFM